MTVTSLAAHADAFQAAYLMTALVVPTVGWILLIVGLKQRSRGRSQPGVLRPPQPSSPNPRGRSSGTTLIVIGTVLLTLGVLAIFGRLASAGPRTSEGSGGAELYSGTGLLTPPMADEPATDGDRQATWRAGRTPNLVI
ncbi:hypothetical protein I546_5894 [Mycobacterium kansasii 732]|uniref:Uncharacterized protein n=1 Tax=Mycobacterium pseudokansasii TaxID=2341080 RepID=A0A498R1P1_9MYCO|nr:hypothetical protein [Mycobacterium pseudokansasii]EUA05863.1 hypothetical protein I546_5894 [Mycobacterium kansasii 732]MBY0390407.1 hypothetical protein [Mycobacterium pseudokansasii]VBA33238.1 hypothetical protein LAUMK35_05410 [Mycobacterium pseudokansasii]VBA34869.1 hypothetical protein LAUMK21_05371 [Mycobacterium pseudokansasii]VBA56040.1 hypothetical protein LAUMK142_05367 [Mycobacterium pseudokansasii]